MSGSIFKELSSCFGTAPLLSSVSFMNSCRLSMSGPLSMAIERLDSVSVVYLLVRLISNSPLSLNGSAFESIHADDAIKASFFSSFTFCIAFLILSSTPIPDFSISETDMDWLFDSFRSRLRSSDSGVVAVSSFLNTIDVPSVCTCPTSTSDGSFVL